MRQQIEWEKNSCTLGQMAMKMSRKYISFFLHKIKIRFKDVNSHSSSFNDYIAWLSFPSAVIAYTLLEGAIKKVWGFKDTL